MPEEKDNAGVGEFLNPKSMLTPGICGAVIMVAVNTLGAAFALAGPTRSFVCLGLSFLAGSLVFASGVKKLLPRIAYYVFNSLIIFSAAAGVNFSGQKALNPESPANSPITYVTNTLIQTQLVTHYVTNGQVSSKPVSTLGGRMTNQVTVPAHAIKQPKMFIQSWK